MSEPVDLLELAERCEKATEGSYDLDLEILRTSSGKPWRLCGAGTVTWDQYGAGAVGNPVYSLDEYSRSIDAALTLVPEGYWVTLSQRKGSWEVLLHIDAGHPLNPLRRKNNSSHAHQAQSPDFLDQWEAVRRGSAIEIKHGALALCAAALRARAAIQ